MSKMSVELGDLMFMRLTGEYFPVSAKNDK